MFCGFLKFLIFLWVICFWHHENFAFESGHLKPRQTVPWLKTGVSWLDTICEGYYFIPLSYIHHRVLFKRWEFSKHFLRYLNVQTDTAGLDSLDIKQWATELHIGRLLCLFIEERYTVLAVSLKKECNRMQLMNKLHL